MVQKPQMQCKMKEYRTQKQLEHIADNCNNGNWKDAAKSFVEHGFSLSDFNAMNAQELFSEGIEDIAVLLQRVINLN